MAKNRKQYVLVQDVEVSECMFGESPLKQGTIVEEFVGFTYGLEQPQRKDDRPLVPVVNPDNPKGKHHDKPAFLLLDSNALLGVVSRGKVEDLVYPTEEIENDENVSEDADRRRGKRYKRIIRVLRVYRISGQSVFDLADRLHLRIKWKKGSKNSKQQLAAAIANSQCSLGRFLDAVHAVSNRRPRTEYLK